MSAPRSHKPRNLDNEEVRLDRELKKLLGARAQDCPAEEWRGMREQMRLALLYPGQFVAFRDQYEGKGASLRLVRREVLEAARTLAGLHKRMAKWSDEEQRGVYVAYVEREDFLSPRS